MHVTDVDVANAMAQARLSAGRVCRPGVEQH